MPQGRGRGKLLRKQSLPKGFGFEKGSPSRQGSGIKTVVKEGIANERPRMPNKTKQKKIKPLVLKNNHLPLL